MSKKIVHAIDLKLSEDLSSAKAEAEVAKRKVAAAEDAICEALVKSVGKMPEKGTIHGTGITVETSFNDKWDQEKLNEIEQTWSRKSNMPFPFKREWKADGKSISDIRDNAADAYKVLSDALTRTPAKPAFTLEQKNV